MFYYFFIVFYDFNCIIIILFTLTSSSRWTGCSGRRSDPADSAKGSSQRVRETELKGVESKQAAAIDIPETPLATYILASTTLALVLGFKYPLATTATATSQWG